MNCSQVFKSLTVFKHHIKKDICASRSKYREGRKDTAVKVYTINQESFYIILTNVPAVGGGEELRALCDQCGIIEEFKPLDDYPSEEFTETYLVKYSSFSCARSAKKYLDDKSFLGGVLHAFYAPEFETIQETRWKLQERRKFIAWKTNSGKKTQTIPTEQSNQTSYKKAGQNCSVASSCSSLNLEAQPISYVWAGKEYFVTPPSVEVRPREIPAEPKTPGIFIPRQCQSSTEQPSSKFISTLNKSSLSTSPMSVTKDNPSYQHTMSEVRTKVSSVSVPNVRVSLKRKKRL